MAIGRRVRIMCWGTGDNSSRKFTIDLLADPYWAGSAQPGGIGDCVLYLQFPKHSGPNRRRPHR
jgi:hypothetical protein